MYEKKSATYSFGPGGHGSYVSLGRIQAAMDELNVPQDAGISFRNTPLGYISGIVFTWREEVQPCGACGQLAVA